MLVIEILKSTEHDVKIILPIVSPPDATAINIWKHFFVVVFVGSVNHRTYC